MIYWNSNTDFGSYWALGEDYEAAKFYSADETDCPLGDLLWFHYDPQDGQWYADQSMKIHCANVSEECCEKVEIKHDPEIWGDTVGVYSRMASLHRNKVGC